MPATAVSQLLYLLDQAFEGSDWHSLLGNLRSVTPDDWEWLPPDGHRSIRDIVGHVGGCKLMYHEYAFGEGALQWDDPILNGGDALATIPTAMDWLRACQSRLRDAIVALPDAELSRHRLTNWGEPRETRWIIAVMIEHDLYHSGEINHIRALRQRDDRWAYNGD